jgi:error-prone DNA polymerase
MVDIALPLHLAAWCPHLGRDRAQLDRLATLAASAGARLLATNNVRYHRPHRRRLADVLSAIRLGVTIDRLGFAAEPNAERCLKSQTEMARLFGDYPDGLAATLDVLAATEGFSLDQLR